MSEELIARLLDINPNDTVAWVGCGDGRELLSLAKMYPEARFIGYEINEAALSIANRVMSTEGIENVSLLDIDFMSVHLKFSHIYSTALAGPALYAHLRKQCTHNLCLLKQMWLLPPKNPRVATVYLSGSGEQRQIWSGTITADSL